MTRHRPSEYDEQPDYWCAACRKPCIAHWVDEGYGETEYWGSVSVHHDWTAYSSCCDADCLDEEPETDEGEDE